MPKKVLPLTLAGLLLSVTAQVSAYTQPQTNGAAPQPEKTKAQVTKLGTGKRARAEVKLSDGTKLKGYIGAISEEGFALVDPKRGTVTTVPYNHVRQIKSANHGGRDLALVLGVTAGLIITVLALVNTTR
jgi:hypothetical protein